MICFLGGRSIVVRPKQNSYRRQRGIASVEFAIGVLVLLFLMLATVEVTRAYYTYATLTKSIRSGVRYIAENARNDASLIDLTDAKKLATRNLMIFGDTSGGQIPVLANFNAAQIDIVEDNATSGAAHPYIRVRAAYDYVPLIGEISKFGIGGGGSYELRFTMSAASNMRVLK